MPSENKERFHWALDYLEIRPDDHVLEIGFGSGMALEIMGAKITSGLICGVDKSAAMCSRADNRFASRSHVSIYHNAFAALELEPQSFDKIFCFNVNFFLKDCKPEMDNINMLLKRNGMVGVFYHLPPGSTLTKLEAMLNKTAELFLSYTFKTKTVLMENSFDRAPVGGVLVSRHLR